MAPGNSEIFTDGIDGRDDGSTLGSIEGTGLG